MAPHRVTRGRDERAAVPAPRTVRTAAGGGIIGPVRPWLALATSGVLYACAVVWSAARLPPDGVPLHFGADGAADRFGSRAELLTGHIVLGALMLGVGIGVVCLARWGPLSLMNVPHKDYWTSAERRPRFRRMLALDLALMMSAVIVFLGLVPVAGVAAVNADPAGLSPFALWSVVGLFVLALLLWCLWLAKYRYRPG